MNAHRQQNLSPPVKLASNLIKRGCDEISDSFHVKWALGFLAGYFKFLAKLDFCTVPLKS